MNKTVTPSKITFLLNGNTALKTNTKRNIPAKSEEALKGIKVCRQARANWKEKFDKRQTPQGKDYYWLTGEFLNLDEGEDTDEYALANNYISLVPVQFDLTAYHSIQQLNTWKLND